MKPSKSCDFLTVHYSFFFIFQKRSPKPTARVTPKELAARSNQSPLRCAVQYSCNSSMTPLMTMGASHAQRKSLPRCRVAWLRRYSIHSTVQVPPYMRMCAHLSIKGTSSNSVSGGLKNERNQMVKIQRMENGYFLTN